MCCSYTLFLSSTCPISFYAWMICKSLLSGLTIKQNSSENVQIQGLEWKWVKENLKKYVLHQFKNIYSGSLLAKYKDMKDDLRVFHRSVWKSSLKLYLILTFCIFNQIKKRHTFIYSVFFSLQDVFSSPSMMWNWKVLINTVKKVMR